MTFSSLAHTPRAVRGARWIGERCAGHGGEGDTHHGTVEMRGDGEGHCGGCW